MISLTLLTALSLSTIPLLTTAQVIAPNSAVPAGYQVGYVTVSHLLRAQFFQQPTSRPFSPTARHRTQRSTKRLHQCLHTRQPLQHHSGSQSPTRWRLRRSHRASDGGGPDDCTPCGTCYSIISSGMPYCSANPYNTSCG